MYVHIVFMLILETSGGLTPVQEVTNWGQTSESQSLDSISPLCNEIDSVKVTCPEESTDAGNLVL